MMFPDDDNGEVLRQMAESGVDLSVEHSVEFAHLAPNQQVAETFAEQAHELGFTVEVYDPDAEALAEGKTHWDVICIREMIPTHHDITSIETELAALARKNGCREDGWGFFV